VGPADEVLQHLASPRAQGKGKRKCQPPIGTTTQN
jgi:hypothetical protein